MHQGLCGILDRTTIKSPMGACSHVLLTILIISELGILRQSAIRTQTEKVSDKKSKNGSERPNEDYEQKGWKGYSLR